MSEQKKQAITREQFARLINGQSTAGDIRAEINEESQLCDYSVYMEATASYTFEVEASSVEQALELARAGEDEDGELFDEIDLETHEGEPTLVYQRGVTGPVWSKPADKDEDEVAADHLTRARLIDTLRVEWGMPELILWSLQTTTLAAVLADLKDDTGDEEDAQN